MDEPIPQNDVEQRIPALDGRGVKIGLDSGPVIDPEAPVEHASAAELSLLTDIAGRLLPVLEGVP